jgi:hypothetical protein
VVSLEFLLVSQNECLLPGSSLDKSIVIYSQPNKGGGASIMSLAKLNGININY